MAVKQLTNAQRDILLEALRRRLKFNYHHQDITEQWTGLGSSVIYAPAVEAGLMKCTSELTDRDIRNKSAMWYQLTPLGAKIVQSWIDLGVTNDDFRLDYRGTIALPIEYTVE